MFPVSRETFGIISSSTVKLLTSETQLSRQSNYYWVLKFGIWARAEASLKTSWFILANIITDPHNSIFLIKGLYSLLTFIKFRIIILLDEVGFIYSNLRNYKCSLHFIGYETFLICNMHGLCCTLFFSNWQFSSYLTIIVVNFLQVRFFQLAARH